MVVNTAIGQITWSDHAPIFLTLTLTPDSGPKPWHWRRDESLLADHTTLAEVKQELSYYFSTNSMDDCDHVLLWEAHKPMMRGILIKHGTSLK